MIDNKKVIALCILHYGKEYLSAAIQAVYPVSDEIVLVYTAKPSHGKGTDAPCPETKEELMEEAKKYDPDNKVFFTEGTFGNEGEHRGNSEELCRQRGAEIIIRFDTDEVWDTESLKEALKITSGSDCKYFGIGHFVNFWKSFNLACYDSFAPIRLININSQSSREVSITGTIYHFSCAQSDITMRYKYLIHGHKDELRPNWLEETYFNWKEGQNDLHMTSIGLWNATPFDKNTLPDVLKNHPNFNKDIIS